MMKTNDLGPLRRILEEAQTWHVWLIEYSITHHFMHIVLHHNDFPRGVEITLEDVLYYSGPLQGGPYRLEVIGGRTGADGRDAETFLLVGNAGELKIEFATATVDRRRT
jgi:hypothetical protein